MGDAMTFICVLRLVSSWFPARRIPLVTQLTGTLGQLGAVVAAIPMTWALRPPRLDPAYLLAAVARRSCWPSRCCCVVHDAPERRAPARPAALAGRGARRACAPRWAHPGTRLGFWMHFSTQFSATTLSLLWGYPFFVRGEGLQPRRRPACCSP